VHTAQVEAEQLCGVEVCALPADGPVEMRTGNAAGGSAQAQPFAALDMLADTYGNPAQVHGECVQPQPVIDDHAVARVVERLSQHHYTAIAGAHRRSRRGAKIQSLVIAGQLAVEDAPRAESLGLRRGHGRAEVALPQRFRSAGGIGFFSEQLVGSDLLERLGTGLDELRRNGERAGGVVGGMNLDGAAQGARAALCVVDGYL